MLFLLRLLNLLLLLALIGVGAWALQPLPQRQQAAPTLSREVASLSLPRFPTVAELEPLWNQNLRPLLYDPPPPVPLPPPKVEPPAPIRLNLQLVGTFLEPNRRRVMLSTPDGRSETRSEGEVITIHAGNILITSVATDRVELEVRQPRTAKFTLTAKGVQEH